VTVVAATWVELRHELYKVNVELDWLERCVTKRTYTWEKAPADAEAAPSTVTAPTTGSR
jgi:hypothetical protein